MPNAPEDWLDAAGRLLGAELSPDRVLLLPEGSSGLFLESLPRPSPSAMRPIRAFSTLLERLLCASESSRHEIAYRLLWRMRHGEPKLLSRPGDPLVRQARRLEQAVRREAHKTKAFVRFREAADGTLVAYHRPSHRVLRLVADFFSERFAVERFAILTPEESLHWDGRRSRFGPGSPAPANLTEDGVQALWLTYYAAIFNPARIKTRAMQAEMPKKHWPTLPETALIPGLVREAPSRRAAMHAVGPSARALAAPAESLVELAAGVQACSLCPHRTPLREGCVVRSSAAVRGVGSETPKLVIVAEQPGELETLFEGGGDGPLGEALAEVGLAQDAVWLTHAVKHLHRVQAGGPRTRLRLRPDTIERCRPWLERELALLGTAPVVGLGEGAALSLLGRRFPALNSVQGPFPGLNDRRIWLGPVPRRDLGDAGLRRQWVKVLRAATADGDTSTEHPA
ncbi:MAG: TIGR03915 family putative DNA repair protein [Myxococcota bacterium]